MVLTAGARDQRYYCRIPCLASLPRFLPRQVDLFQFSLLIGRIYTKMPPWNKEIPTAVP